MTDFNTRSQDVHIEDAVSVIPELIAEPTGTSAASSHPPPPPRLRARAASHERRPLSLDVDTPEVARDLMTRQLLTIGPDDLLESLEGYMQAYQFRHLPVVEGAVLVGLITHSDLLHAFSSKLSKSAPEENVIIRSQPARMIMRRDVVTVRPSEPLVNIAALFWQSRVGCLPVTEQDGSLVGIITEGDFIRLAHHFLVARKEAQAVPYRDTLPGATAEEEADDYATPV